MYGDYDTFDGSETNFIGEGYLRDDGVYVLPTAFSATNYNDALLYDNFFDFSAFDFGDINRDIADNIDAGRLGFEIPTGFGSSGTTTTPFTGLTGLTTITPTSYGTPMLRRRRANQNPKLTENLLGSIPNVHANVALMAKAVNYFGPPVNQQIYTAIYNAMSNSGVYVTNMQQISGDSTPIQDYYYYFEQAGGARLIEQLFPDDPDLQAVFKNAFAEAADQAYSGSSTDEFAGPEVVFAREGYNFSKGTPMSYDLLTLKEANELASGGSGQGQGFAFVRPDGIVGFLDKYGVSHTSARPAIEGATGYQEPDGYRIQSYNDPANFIIQNGEKVYFYEARGFAGNEPTPSDIRVLGQDINGNDIINPNYVDPNAPEALTANEQSLVNSGLYTDNGDGTITENSTGNIYNQNPDNPLQYDVTEPEPQPEPEPEPQPQPEPQPEPEPEPEPDPEPEPRINYLDPEIDNSFVNLVRDRSFFYNPVTNQLVSSTNPEFTINADSQSPELLEALLDIESRNVDGFSITAIDDPRYGDRHYLLQDGTMVDRFNQPYTGEIFGADEFDANLNTGVNTDFDDSLNTGVNTNLNDDFNTGVNTDLNDDFNIGVNLNDGGLNVNVLEPDANERGDEVLGSVYAADPDRLLQIAQRFEQNMTEPARQLQETVAQTISRLASPSEYNQMDSRDAAMDRLANQMLGANLTPLQHITILKNIAEGITDTELINLPNVGFLINNLYDQVIPLEIRNSLDLIIPDVMSDFFLGPKGGFTDYLAQNFDLSEVLFQNSSLINAIQLGVVPTEQQIDQNIDYAKEFFGPDYDLFFSGVDRSFFSPAKFGAITDGVEEDPQNFLSRIYDNIGDVVSRITPEAIKRLGATASNIGEVIDNKLEDYAIAVNRYTGGLVPTTVLNALGASTGLPVGTLINMLTGAFMPQTPQELADAIYRNTGRGFGEVRYSDLSAYGGDETIPLFSEQQYRDAIFDIEDQDTRVGFGNFLSQIFGEDTIAGRLFGGENAIDLLQETASNTVENITDTAANAAGAFIPGINTSEGNANNPVLEDKTTNPATGLPGSPGATEPNLASPRPEPDDGSGGTGLPLDPTLNNPGVAPETPIPIDPNAKIDTGTPPIMTTPTEEGAPYDAAYETARLLIGADAAEAYRGKGVADLPFIELINQYQSDVLGFEFDRAAELNEKEQALINRLRGVQRGSDLALLGEYGQDFANQVRGLDPTAVSMLGQQEELANRLYSEASGELSPERKARAQERAFEIYAAQGRERDPSFAVESLFQDEAMRQSLEARAQNAGMNTFNQSRALTGDIPGMLLGTGSSPYGTGVGTVTPIIGMGDVLQAGQASYNQQQDFAAALADRERVVQDLAQARADGDVSRVESAQNRLNEINSYIELAKSVPTIIQGASDFIGGIPDYYDDITQGFRNLGSNVMNLGRRIIGGRSTTTPYRPGTADLSNVRNYDDLIGRYT